jgi:hypothetical protein
MRWIIVRNGAYESWASLMTAYKKKNPIKKVHVSMRWTRGSRAYTKENDKKTEWGQTYIMITGDIVIDLFAIFCETLILI